MGFMLTLSGQYLGTNRKMVHPREGGKQFTPFERVTIDVLVTGTEGSRVEPCEPTQAFSLASLPAHGEPVELEVFLGQYGLKAVSVVGARRLAAAE